MRLWLAAVGLLIIAATIAAYFVWRGPMLVAAPRALTWSRMTPNSGGVSVEGNWFGVDFVTLRDADEPVLSYGGLHRGDEWVVLDELNCFEQFVPVDGGVWVLGEWCTEGGGPSAELLFLAQDGGVTWVASLPKPVYYATLKSFVVQEDVLEIDVEVDPDEGVGGLPDEWVFAPWRFEPLTRFRPGTGPFVRIASKNGGRTWRMDRHAQPR
jgi:hypothetical protein